MIEFICSGKQTDLQTARKIARGLSISVRTAMLMMERGVTSEIQAEEFLYPSASRMCDPFLFNEMNKAVERINGAIDSGEKICVYGDYDADGVCATAILLIHLKSLGANVAYRIPSRHDEGYGLNINAVRDMARDGINLIITVDNGIKSIDELLLAKELGMDTIVSDHHIVSEKRPECVAILCHTEPQCDYPNKNICGAGTALKIVEALSGRESAMRYIALAGIATIADIVPLTGENRIIAALAVDALNKKECPIGLSVLGSLARGKENTYTAFDVAFGIAPRLNAAGRMENADAAVELLICEDNDEAQTLAKRLCDLNAQRQSEETAIYRHACTLTDAADITDTRTLVYKNADYNVGIVGIAASRVAEKYARPTLLLNENDGILSGSARSIKGVNLYEALRKNEELFIRYGGHAFASGVTMKAENYDAFVCGFENAMRSSTCDEDFIPKCEYESMISFSELTVHFLEETAQLAPFGEGNPAPVFRTDDITLVRLKRIGTDGAHIKGVAMKDGIYISFIHYNAGEHFDELMAFPKCDIVFSPEINEYNGTREVQLNIRAVRRTVSEDTIKYISASQTKFYDAISRNIRYNSMRMCKEIPFIDAQAQIKELFEHSLKGTVVLCFTKYGACSLVRFLSDNELERRADIMFSCNTPCPCAYNCVIMAPRLESVTLSRYKNIVIYDTPIFSGSLYALCACAPNARIMVSDKPVECRDEIIEDFSFNREKLGVLYKVFASKKERHFNREAAISYMADMSQRGEYECDIALSVFEQLSLVKVIDGCYELEKNTGKKTLDDSVIYRMLSKTEETIYDCDYARRNNDGAEG